MFRHYVKFDTIFRNMEQLNKWNQLTIIKRHYAFVLQFQIAWKVSEKNAFS